MGSPPVLDQAQLRCGVEQKNQAQGRPIAADDRQSQQINGLEDLIGDQAASGTRANGGARLSNIGDRHAPGARRNLPGK